MNHFFAGKARDDMCNVRTGAFVLNALLYVNITGGGYMAEDEMKPRSAVLREALEKARHDGKQLTTLLSVPEACKQLSISRWTLYKEKREGNLKTVKIRGRRLVSLKAIERYIEKLENEEAEA
jgi:excisionase family DNA binding protein